MSGMVVWYNPKPPTSNRTVYSCYTSHRWLTLAPKLSESQQFLITIRHGLFSFRVILQAAPHNIWDSFKFQFTCCRTLLLDSSKCWYQSWPRLILLFQLDFWKSIRQKCVLHLSTAALNLASKIRWSGLNKIVHSLILKLATCLSDDSHMIELIWPRY